MSKEQMINLLKVLVEKESPSHDDEAVRGVLKFLEGYCADLGAETEWLIDKNQKAQLKASWGNGEQQILIMSHVDTVWPIGEIQKRPFQMKDGKITGPGVLDMKAGIVQAIFALKSLLETGLPNNTKIVMLFTIDEEIGSASSRKWIEEEGQKSCAVLVPEPASSGKLKIARKGWAMYTLQVFGKAAHAGNDPEKGESAILEITHQIQRIYSALGHYNGIHVNAGVIKGGSRANVIADWAMTEIDIRFSSGDEKNIVEDLMGRLNPMNPHTRLEITGGLNRGPMEFTKENELLFELAKEAGTELGLVVEGVAVGGVSDGNLTSNLGIPTLDGLGAVGEGPHALHEYIVADEVVTRSRLLASLIQKISQSEDFSTKKLQNQ